MVCVSKHQVASDQHKHSTFGGKEEHTFLSHKISMNSGNRSKPLTMAVLNQIPRYQMHNIHYTLYIIRSYRK